MLNSDDITIFITLPSISNVTQGAYPTNARKPDVATSEEKESIKTYFQAFSSNNESSILALKPRERARAS